MIFKMADGGYVGFRHQERTKTQIQPFKNVCHANVGTKRQLVCPSSSSGAKDMNISDFSRWQMAAILDIATREVPKLNNNHSRVCGMPMLVEIDT